MNSTNRPHPTEPRRWLASSIALAACLAACSSEDSTQVQMPLTPQQPQTPNGAGDGAPAGQSPVYAMAPFAIGPDATSSYLTTLPSLEAGTVMDLDTAIELPGFWSVVGVDRYPAVWLVSSDSTIERWDLESDGSLSRGDVIDFSNLGVADVGQSQNGVFTLERAIFASNATGELVHWNPSTMEIIGTTPIGIPDAGAIPPFVRNLRQRPDGTLVASYYYIDADGNLGDGAGVVILSADGSQVLGRDEWDDCSYNVAAGATSDGTTYFSAGAQWVQRNLVNPPDAPYTAPACALRVLRADNTYDRDFDYANLGDLIGGRAVNGTLTVAGDDLAYFVAWHDELVPEPLTLENYDTLAYSTPAWKWYAWDLASAEASEVPNAEPFASLPELEAIDGRLFFADQRLTSENGGRGITPFHELTPDGVKPAFTAFGSMYTLVRLR